MQKSIFLIGCIFLLTGCTSIYERLGTSRNLSDIDLSEKTSHYRDALNLLGPPKVVSANDEGLFFLYETIELKEYQVGLHLDYGPLAWLEFVKLSIAKGYSDRKAALLVFDNNGILQSKSYTAWSDKLGTGFSFSLSFMVHKVIDTSGFDDAIGPNQWGMSLLRPLPEQLNTQQSLDSGMNGLELTNTPTSAGQHSLEMR